MESGGIGSMTSYGRMTERVKRSTGLIMCLVLSFILLPGIDPAFAAAESPSVDPVKNNDGICYIDP